MFYIIDELRIRIHHNFIKRLVVIDALCPSFVILPPFLTLRCRRLRKRKMNREFLLILHLAFAQALVIASKGCYWTLVGLG